MILRSVTESLVYIVKKPFLLVPLLLPVLVSILTLPFGVLPNLAYFLVFLYCLMWFVLLVHDEKMAWRKAVKIFPRAALLFLSGFALILLGLVMYFSLLPLLSAFYSGFVQVYPSASPIGSVFFPLLILGYLLLNVLLSVQGFHWFLFAFNPALSLKECYRKGLLIWSMRHNWRLTLLTLIIFVPSYTLFALVSMHQGFTDPLLLLSQSPLQYALDVLVKSFPLMLSIGIELIALEYYHGDAQ